MDNAENSGSKKDLELCDKLGEAISGSDGTPPSSHR